MRTCIMVGLLLLSGSLLATAVPVTGRLLTAEGEALGYATASVFADSTLVEGTVTREDGAFTLRLEPGDYTFVFEYLGYGRLSTNRRITEATALGDLILQPDAIITEMVEVRAKRTTVSLQLDRKVYNIGQDALARGGSATEVLDQLPSVTVSAEGEISLRGDGAVKILIDGRPSALAESGGLSSLSADAIERVEIITNPGSRYEASGSAGIINIILKKDPEKGYGGTLGVTAGAPADYRADLNLNYRRGKWKTYGTLGVRQAKFLGERELFRTQVGEPRYVELRQDSRSEQRDKAWNAYWGFDYQLAEKISLTASYSLNAVNNDDRGSGDYRYANAEGAPTETWRQANRYTEPFRYGQVDVSFNQDFRQEGRKLTWVFQRTQLSELETSSVATDQIFPTAASVTKYVTANDEAGNNLLLQVDYVHPLSERTKLEFGARADRRLVGADYSVDVAPALQNSFTYVERIGAGYAQYAFTGDKLGVQVGLRGEYTEQELNYVADPENDYLRTYPRLFPSLSLSYQFTEATQSQLSFSRRIWRPQFYQINPFPTISSPTRYTTGNPDLSPVISDRLELNVLRKSDKWTISAAVYAGIVRDFQFYVNERFDENLFGLETGTIVSRPINLADEYRLGTDINVEYRRSETLSFGFNANGFTFKQTGSYKGEDLSTAQSVGYFSLRTDVTLPAQLELTASINYQTPYRTVQTYWFSYPVVNLALSRKLGERLTLTGNVVSPRAYRNQIFRPDFRSEGAGSWSRWRGRLTAQYKFEKHSAG